MRVLFFWFAAILLSLELQNLVAIQQDERKICVDNDGKSVVGTVGLRTDCRKYVLCGPSGEFVQQCQPGLLFNKAQKYCDWPHLADCVEFRARDDTKLVIPAADIVW